METIRAYHQEGIEILDAVTRALRTQSKEEVAQEFCVSTRTIHRFTWVRGFFKDREVHKAAKGVPLESLDGIAQQLKTLRPEHRAKVALQCLELAKAKSVDAAIADAKHLVEAYRQENGYQPKRSETVNVQKDPDANGQRRLVGVFNDHTLTAMLKKLNPATEQYEREGLQRNQALARALSDAVLNTSNDQPLEYQPGLLLPLRPSEGYFKDGKVYTFDGAGVPLSELDGLPIADTGFLIATALDSNGKIGAEAIPIRRRFADTNQRILLATELLVCPYPDCQEPAGRCQFHHIQAFSQGGETTTNNLVLLCKTHNGMNDDSPDHHRNGRIERDPDTGDPHHKRTPNSPPRTNDHPAIRKGWRAETKAFLDS